jgi:HisJ family histidinol phosphate phosphatase
MKFEYTDYHIHTNYSHDIKENGPSFKDYIQIAEENEINICFLDHYELYYVENDKTYPFYGGRINNYLEDIDNLKEEYDFILSGLELDYYPDREESLQEFMDDFGKELDFIGGSVHEFLYEYPVTSKSLLKNLIQKMSLEEIIETYFHSMEKMIESEIFSNICHIDTVFRYINSSEIKPPKDLRDYETKIVNLGEKCIEKGISVEYNLSGTRFSLGRPFPSFKMMKYLIQKGLNYFVGSDSHSLEYFKSQILNVKKAYEVLG